MWRRENVKWFVVIVLFLANFLVWYAVQAEDRGGLLTVAFLDIGQGDSIFIDAPNGNQILLDGGRGRQVLEALAAEMPFYDRSLDLVIASHPDADHIGGLTDVFENYEVTGFLEPGVPADTGVYERLQSDVAAEGAQTMLAERGMRIVLDDLHGVYLTILFPDRDPSGMETNEASIIAKLTYGEIDFLLTGDSPAKIEKYLTGVDGAMLQAEVLKAGHHGSKTSTSDAFLGAVAPEYAVISVGKNSYGHPSPEVLDRLEAAKIKTFRTDELGTILFATDGEKIYTNWTSLSGIRANVVSENLF